MEDKAFELLSKIYGELSEFRKETNNRLGTLEGGQKRVEMRMEQNVELKMQALFDHRDIIDEKLELIENSLEAIEKKVEDISMKVDSQEVEIKVIKVGNAKKVK
jgi:hypothetical protein